MTLAQGITRILQRTGKSITDSDFKDRARNYVNMILAEHMPLIPWWWLDKTTTFTTTETFTISIIAGTFTAGETITGDGGSTAVVDAYTAGATTITAHTISAAFTASETVTGGTSGATATYASTTRTRTYTPVSGNVTAWHSFVDQSNNRTLDIISNDAYDSFDPDRDQEGDARAVYISGVDATTGDPAIDIFPLAPASDVLRIRYRKDVDEWTSSNDATDFLVLGIPRVFESVLVYGATALYLEDEGDDSGANRESQNLARALDAARRQNKGMQGNRQFFGRDSGDEFSALIRVDSSIVSAA